MDDSFKFTVNSDLSENTSEHECSSSDCHILLEFTVKRSFYPPLKYTHVRDRAWSRIYPDGTISIHEYLLQEKIGSGAYAEVFVAEHSVLRKKFALRMVDRTRLLKSFVTQEASDKFLWSAAMLMDRVSHPNVVKLYEVMFNVLVTVSPYMRADRLDGPKSPLVYQAGTVYNDIGMGFCTSHSLEMSSVKLRVSTHMTNPAKELTQDMVKGMLMQPSFSQVYNTDNRTMMKLPENIDSYDNMFIYVTELCHWKDLSSTIKHLTLSDITVLFYQLAYALEHLHSLLIVHHDVKLENVMLDCSSDNVDWSLSAHRKKAQVTWQCGMDLSQVQFVKLFQNTAKCQDCSRSNPNHLGADLLALTADDINNPDKLALFAMSRAGFTPCCAGTQPQHHPLPYIPLGAYNYGGSISYQGLASTDLNKIMAFYLYYSSIYSINFGPRHRDAFSKMLRRNNINNYPLVAKISDFDTARDLHVHGRVLPSLQDLLIRIAHELIHVFIDLFSNDGALFLSTSSALSAFLDEFFFSTISCNQAHYKSNILRTKYSSVRMDAEQLIGPSRGSIESELRSPVSTDSRVDSHHTTISLSFSTTSGLSLAKSAYPQDHANGASTPNMGVQGRTYSNKTATCELRRSYSPKTDYTLTHVSCCNTAQVAPTNSASESASLLASAQASAHNSRSCSNIGQRPSSIGDKNDISIAFQNSPNNRDNLSRSFENISSCNSMYSTLSPPKSKLSSIKGGCDIASRPRLQRHRTEFKPLSNHLPHVYKKISLSQSHKCITRRSPSSTRLYLQYFLKYLTALESEDLTNKATLEKFYYLIELLDKHFTSCIFEQKLSERLTILFSASEFICHNPMSVHTYPAYLSSVAGTRLYMPPESLRVWNMTTNMAPNFYMAMPSDVWQFGVTLYTAIIGKYRKTPLQRSAPEAIKIATSLSLLLGDLLCGLLAPSPMLRYTMDEVVNHPFFDNGNFPLTAADDQLFSISFSDYRGGLSTLKDTTNSTLCADPITDFLHRTVSGNSSLHSQLTVVSNAANVDLTCSEPRFTPTPASLVSDSFRNQPGIDAWSIRKGIDFMLRFMMHCNSQGKDILKMNLRLRRFHHWITVKRRDALVRKHRHILRRSSISNDEIYGLLDKRGSERNVVLSSLHAKSNLYCDIPKPQVCADKTKESLWSSKISIIHEHVFEEPSENVESIQTTIELISDSDNDNEQSTQSEHVDVAEQDEQQTPLPNTKKSSPHVGLLTVSTPALPRCEVIPRKYSGSSTLRNDWTNSCTGSGQFDSMSVAAGDSLLNQLQNEMYLMLNLLHWKSSFIRMKTPILSHSTRYCNQNKEKKLFYQLYNTNGTSFLELNPFVDIEICIKDISMATNAAFPVLVNSFSTGLLDDITEAQGSNNGSVSTRNLEYIFTTSLLKSVGNVWGLVKALKSIQVGFVLENLVSTVPYFEKFTASRLNWIRHLYLDMKYARNIRAASFSTETKKTPQFRPRSSSTVCSPCQNHVLSPTILAGMQTPHRRSTGKLISSGMNRVFTNQQAQKDTMASTVYTTMTHSYSTDILSTKSASVKLYTQDDFNVNLPTPQPWSELDSIILQNGPETIRWNYSVNDENDDVAASECAVSAITDETTSHATALDDDKLISFLDTLNNSNADGSAYNTMTAPRVVSFVDLSENRASIGGNTRNELSRSDLSVGQLVTADNVCNFFKTRVITNLRVKSVPQPSSTGMLSKFLLQTKNDFTVGLKEYFRDDFGESIVSGYSISEYGNDELASIEGRVNCDIVKNSSLFIFPPSQTTGDRVANSNILLLHSPSNTLKEISLLYPEIQDALQSSSNSRSLYLVRSTDQLATQSITQSSSPKKIGAHSFCADVALEKSDSNRLGSIHQRTTMLKRHNGSTNALTGIFSEMSMQCKNMEKMSRFVSMQASSSYSSSSGHDTFMSSALPRTDRTPESGCDRNRESIDVNALNMQSTSSVEQLVSVAPKTCSTPGLCRGPFGDASIRKSKTILNVPATSSNLFNVRKVTIREDSTDGISAAAPPQHTNHVYHPRVSSMSDKMPSITSKETDKLSSVAGEADNITPCVLDIFDSVPPKEEELNSASLMVKVSEFLGLDMENLEDIEIEYSASSFK